MCVLVLVKAESWPRIAMSKFTTLAPVALDRLSCECAAAGATAISEEPLNLNSLQVLCVGVNL